MSKTSRNNRSLPRRGKPLSPREKAMVRAALARRRLEQLRDQKMLQQQITDVWDEPA